MNMLKRIFGPQRDKVKEELEGELVRICRRHAEVGNAPHSPRPPNT
jgi:hypothetical protein